MNPYAVLGVSENADKEEIKKAYHKLVRENHPDRFLDEEEKKKATERLAKINEAYNMIEKGETVYSDDSGYGGEEIYARIRRFISLNDLFGAQSLLNAVTNRTAQWHYLQGVVFLRQGFYDSARAHLKTAVDMEPMNSEYVNAYNNMEARAGDFFGSNPYINIRGFDLNRCCLTTTCATGCASMCCGKVLCDGVYCLGSLCGR